MANPKRRSILVQAAAVAPPRREYWRALVEECGRSGLSQAEFCRRRGIAKGTLSFWKSVLARRVGPGAHPAKAGLAGSPSRPAFVPVQVVGPRPSGAPGDAGPPRAADALEIVLGGGRLVRVREGVDAQWLGQVVGTLETPEC